MLASNIGPLILVLTASAPPSPFPQKTSDVRGGRGWLSWDFPSRYPPALRVSVSLSSSSPSSSSRNGARMTALRRLVSNTATPPSITATRIVVCGRGGENEEWGGVLLLVLSIPHFSGAQPCLPPPSLPPFFAVGAASALSPASLLAQSTVNRAIDTARVWGGALLAPDAIAGEEEEEEMSWYSPFFRRPMMTALGSFFALLRESPAFTREGEEVGISSVV
mmetsp:Transcript_18476/g.30042  ORF Transcript_18476/g.30042 Transcript_18476/m.30042 type:complete len:221 (-) Transcript_18476:366-1028(-)